ncbi:MAG: Hsp70 family protein, partial [Verrucomicrobiales bacterium]
MSKIVGIDLGTTNSAVATVDAGVPYVIADADGRRLTPSVVHYSKEGKVSTGAGASRLKAVDPEKTVYSIKRFIGRRASEVSEGERDMPYALKGDGPLPLRVEFEDKHYLPEEISAEILKKLKKDAEQHFSQGVTRAVITVPAYFNDAQRQATKRAGELAGFTVERIINEPTAAALAYGLDKLQEKAKIAVYDLGGGTFDLSILEMNAGVFQVLSTHGNTKLGGDDLDAR